MRTAHETVGGLVRECETKSCRLVDLPSERLEALLPGKGTLIARVLGVHNALQAFQSYGSTAPGRVDEQLTAWRDRLKEPVA